MDRFQGGQGGGAPPGIPAIEQCPEDMEGEPLRVVGKAAEFLLLQGPGDAQPVFRKGRLLEEPGEDNQAGIQVFFLEG